MTIVLALTAERTEPAWDECEPQWGCAIIRLGPHEIGRVELTYSQWENGREGIEEAAASWLAKRFAREVPA